MGGVNMYNFLVCYDETNWESGTGYMPKERCSINYSDNNVKKTLSGRYCSDHIEQIKLYPCILSYEKVHEKDAYIARITDVRYLGNEVKISFNKVDTLPFHQLINLTSELGINMSSRGLTELDHTHWSIKDLDLYDELCKAGIEMQSLKKPIVFISYSWDDVAHRDWVKHLSDELEKHAIKTILDQVDLIPGDQLPQFMEHSITNSDYVLIICTPKYKKKRMPEMAALAMRSLLLHPMY